MEQEALADQLDLGTAANYPQTPADIGAIQTFLPVFQCPSAPANVLVVAILYIPGGRDCAETNYAAVVTSNPIFIDPNGVPGDAAERFGNGAMRGEAQTPMGATGRTRDPTGCLGVLGGRGQRTPS